ncbi:hypothetical protein ACLKA6_018854 [Drosophila palustris]
MSLCGVCKRKGTTTESWVQCDQCKDWFHFACVGVDENIVYQPWNCNNCEKLINISSHVMHSPPQRNMSLTKESTEVSGAAQAQSQSKEETQQEPSALNINTNANTNAHGALNQHQLMLAMLEEKRATDERYIEQKYKLLAQMNGQDFTLPIYAPPPVAGIGGPSSSQLAARHAIPKELPKFSGDPEDWPCFISTFEHSTSVAGLSDVENMLRLQKCLGGKARELVKDKLLIPSMVSDVISTLKMFFGRPEHILERMIDRVRKLPPPKDRLESFIDFALAVRNICAMMEASNLTAHLNNPMLVKELVDKLPNKHKLDWAMYPKSCQPPVKEFSDWIYKIAEAASTVICPSTYKANPVNSHYEDPNQASSSNHKVAAATPTPTPKQNTSKCMACGSQEHSAPQCESFNKMSVDERWTKAKSARACYRCLKNHRKGCFMKKTCGLKVNNITYWSDSKTVLQWLKMDPRKFQQFVMHRIGEILESQMSSNGVGFQPK